MTRKKTLKSTVKQIAKDFSQEVAAFTDENKQINEEMIGEFLDDPQAGQKPPKITLV